MKVSKREQNWQEHYAQLLAYVQEHRHLPDKRKVENRGLLNWWKYNKKLAKLGKLSESCLCISQYMPDYAVDSSE